MVLGSEGFVAAGFEAAGGAVASRALADSGRTVGAGPGSTALAARGSRASVGRGPRALAAGTTAASFRARGQASSRPAAGVRQVAVPTTGPTPARAAGRTRRPGSAGSPAV